MPRPHRSMLSAPSFSLQRRAECPAGTSFLGSVPSQQKSLSALWILAPLIVNRNTSTFVQSQVEVEDVKPPLAITILTSDSPPGLSDFFGPAGAASDSQILKGFQGRSPWLALTWRMPMGVHGGTTAFPAVPGSNPGALIFLVASSVQNRGRMPAGITSRKCPDCCWA
jgi:hypothetical protein